MTGSDMGGLFIGFAKYICIFFGVVFGVGAFFTSGWLLLLVATLAVALLGLAWKFHIDIARAEAAYYASRRQSEASMRQNNPFYDALCQLGERLKAEGLSNYTTGQRNGSARDGSGNRIDYLLVRVEVETRDAVGEPITAKGGVPVALWQATIPSAIGNYPVRLEFFD
ncbi:MAG: hypothetical protein WC028_24860 [Candidatus Obscuribacterales bacterium]